MNRTNHFAMTFPALNGEVVTQGHADYCAANGHATHKIDGAIQDRCPRCGDLLPTDPREAKLAEVGTGNPAGQTLTRQQAHERISCGLPVYSVPRGNTLYLFPDLEDASAWAESLGQTHVLDWETGEYAE